MANNLHYYLNTLLTECQVCFIMITRGYSMRDNLSFLEQIALDIINEDIKKNNGVSRITNKEITLDCLVSERTIIRYVRKLERLGYIKVEVHENYRLIRKGGVD